MAGETDSWASRLRSPLSRFCKRPNAGDYLGLLVLVLAYIPTFFITPFHRMFFVNDTRIAFPHGQERVPFAICVVFAIFLPLCILVIHRLTNRSPDAKLEASLLPLATALALTTFLTEIIKDAVGRPRPDLLDRCRPAEGTQPNVPVGIDVCSAPDTATLHDGWRSFPSGHSSVSFAGLGFLSLFLAGQLHVFDSSAGRSFGHALLCLLPLLCAAFIAISRLEDYHHDGYDVSCGSALGMTIAYWSYRRYWPKLSSPDCHEPLPNPAEGAQQWRRVRDEEEAGAERGSSVELQEIRAAPG